MKRKHSFFGIKRVIGFCSLTILVFSLSTASAFGDIYKNFRELSSKDIKNEDPSPPAEEAIIEKDEGPVPVEEEAIVKENEDINTPAEKAVTEENEMPGAPIKQVIKENADYRIETVTTDSNIIVIAIHGGKIEKGTTELAYAISSFNSYNYYSFLGLKSKGNLSLHITSDKFDEPTALEMVLKSKITLSIHGTSGSKEFTYIGGLDTELGNRIKESLTKYNFTTLDTPKNLAGTSSNNIVNKNMSGMGVQLELSEGLRIKFLSNNDSLKRYVSAISEAVYGIIKDR